MTRIHLGIIFELETEQFLSEKAAAGGGITKVTLTSGAVFAAKNLFVYGWKDILR